MYYVMTLYHIYMYSYHSSLCIFCVPGKEERRRMAFQPSRACIIIIIIVPVLCPAALPHYYYFTFGTENISTACLACMHFSIPSDLMCFASFACLALHTHTHRETRQVEQAGHFHIFDIVTDPLPLPSHVLRWWLVGGCTATPFPSTPTIILCTLLLPPFFLPFSCLAHFLFYFVFRGFGTGRFFLPTSVWFGIGHIFIVFLFFFLFLFAATTTTTISPFFPFFLLAFFPEQTCFPHYHSIRFLQLLFMYLPQILPTGRWWWCRQVLLLVHWLVGWTLLYWTWFWLMDLMLPLPSFFVI